MSQVYAERAATRPISPDTTDARRGTRESVDAPQHTRSAPEALAFDLERMTPLARFLRAVSHRHRLAMLALLLDDERDVSTLAGELDLSLSRTSQHLSQLKQLGLVEERREGRRVFHRVVEETTTRWLLSGAGATAP